MNWSFNSSREASRSGGPLLLLTVILIAARGNAGTGAAQATWWKGNLHTHSLWSDGDDYPEMVVDWYKSHGYHFLALSDHNVVMSGVKWIVAATNNFGFVTRPAVAATTNLTTAQIFNKYLRRFGRAWVETRGRNG